MICIFSAREDLSTVDVMRWLRYLGSNDIIRINSDDGENDGFIRLEVNSDSFLFQYGGRVISMKDIDAVWYRKGRHWLCNQFQQPTVDGDPKLTSYLRKKVEKEELRLSEYCQFLLAGTVSSIGSATRCDLNKLIVLHLAKSVGLLVPDFIVSNALSSIVRSSSAKRSISKAISDIVYLFENEQANLGYFSYTESITSGYLDGLQERISPSLVQEEIVKDFEARIFFLDGKCHAMAIFSQSDESTRVDFRHYNTKMPNRTVPLKLDRELEQKISQLFERLELNTGSVDFLVDREKHYFFLEINPVGQFSMVSRPCNLYLERAVASTLMKIEARHDR